MQRINDFVYRTVISSLYKLYHKKEPSQFEVVSLFSQGNAEISKSIEAEMVEDEMDKLIALKSMRISFAVAGTGFIAALVWLVVNQNAVLMLNILFVSFSLGSLVEGLAQIYYYRKGVRNG